jgi:hypothetical protein
VSLVLCVVLASAQKAHVVGTPPGRRSKNFATEKGPRAARLLAHDLLKPAAADRLQMWPISKRVNSSRTPGDDSTLIEEVKDAA